MAATAAVIPFSGLMASELIGKTGNNYPVSLFSKPLDPYEPEFMFETLVQSGMTGLEPTVRPKGRIEPERVVHDLPKLIDMANKYQIETKMMVTSILDSTDPYAKEVLAVAAKNGIKHYRMGWYDYDFNLGVTGSLSVLKKKMERLVEMNREAGIQAGYQNHTGTGVGAPMWDVWVLINDLPKEWMSSQFDVRHANTEGSTSWIIAMRLLAKNIGSLAIKDFTWEIANGKARVVNVPLGEGIIDFDLYFKTLKELNIIAPFTLHIEYPMLDSSEENLTLLQKQKIFSSKIKKDFDFIQSHLIKHQLI